MKQVKSCLAILLCLALLLGGCQQPAAPTEAAVTEPVPETTAPSPWEAAEGWTLEGTALTSPKTKDSLILHGSAELDPSWELTATVTMGKAEAVRLVLYKENGEALAAATLSVASRMVKLGMDMRSGNRWKNLVQSDAVYLDPQKPAQLSLRHLEESENVWFTLSQEGQELLSFKISDLTTRTLLMAARAGLGADGEAVFSDFAVAVPVRQPSPAELVMQEMSPEDEGFYLALAQLTVDDMLKNFWEGDLEAGRIMPTSHGYATHTDYTCMWESGMLLYELYDMWTLTGNEDYKTMLAAEAAYIKGQYDFDALQRAAGDQNWASDDCAWNAMLYLIFYDVTGDEWFLDVTVGLLDSVNERWYDEELGGLYYKDGVDFMSLYEVGIAWSWLRLWEITGDQRFYDLALRSYEGMHYRLGKDRDDGIYFIEANKYAPKGDPARIGEAGSSSFLTGNMGMAALAARFYHITGEQEYLDRVYRINEGMLKYYDNDGVLLNDRDAWTNGVYAAAYASWVLTLPGTEEMQTLVKNTALSIVTNARTEDGYYGGSWSGPAEGAGSVWYNGGSKPQQSMTTGTSVLMVVAAAMLESGIQHYTRG